MLHSLIFLRVCIVISSCYAQKTKISANVNAASIALNGKIFQSQLSSFLFEDNKLLSSKQNLRLFFQFK